jgi:AcrR family transcriptional regulator
MNQQPMSQTTSRSTSQAVTQASDLRRRILDASAALLESDGLAALSLREVARRAGVSHQAPYHHFKDRETILAELVAEGFERLARRLAHANDQAGALGVRGALLESCRSYVGFALGYPGLFRIMCRPEVVDLSRFASAQAASDQAYAELERMVVLVHGRADEALISQHWAQVHGLACLILDGGLGMRLSGARARRDHVRQSLERYVDTVLGSSAAR